MAGKDGKAILDLHTQKDGRRFAIELLKKIEEVRSDGRFSIAEGEPDDSAPGKMFLYRHGPQSQEIRQAFDAVYGAPEEARRGFFAVMTDYLGSAPDGHLDPSSYEDWETEGKIKDEPEPEVLEIVNALMAEPEGMLPKGFAESVEEDLTGPGALAISRRIALVFLEKPFREIAESAEKNREFAVSMSHVADVLENHIERYRSLVDWLTAAHTRMWVAVCAREDREEVVKEARTEGDKANDELQRARFIRAMRDRK